jgi:hypothetical protein
MTDDHLRAGAIYDPSVSGAIANVSYSFDVNTLEDSDFGAVGYGLALFQNGNYYVDLHAIHTSGAWVSFAFSNLSAEDFSIFAFPSPADPEHPDFSAVAGAGTGSTVTDQLSMPLREDVVGWPQQFPFSVK